MFMKEIWMNDDCSFQGVFYIHMYIKMCVCVYIYIYVFLLFQERSSWFLRRSSSKAFLSVGISISACHVLYLFIECTKFIYHIWYHRSMGKSELVLAEWSPLQSMHLFIFLQGEILIPAIQGFNSHSLQPSGIRGMSFVPQKWKCS